MSKHTPGPWTAQWDETNKRCKIGHWFWTAQDKAFPGHYVVLDLKRQTPEATANARLIAAAPDLLKALKKLVARCNSDPSMRADMNTLQAHLAIAEAEGEQ